MSIELRIRDHQIECDWGRINPAADPEPKQLLLATRAQVESLLDGCAPDRHGGIISATKSDDGQLFAHLYRDGNHWVWELFDAHFADGDGPQDMMVGRWPD